jgi:hypothetical protein
MRPASTPSSATEVAVLEVPASSSPESTVTSYSPFGTSARNCHGVPATKSFFTASIGTVPPSVERWREMSVTPAPGTTP